MARLRTVNRRRLNKLHPATIFSQLANRELRHPMHQEGKSWLDLPEHARVLDFRAPDLVKGTDPMDPDINMSSFRGGKRQFDRATLARYHRPDGATVFLKRRFHHNDIRVLPRGMSDPQPPRQFDKSDMLGKLATAAYDALGDQLSTPTGPLPKKSADEALAERASALEEKMAERVDRMAARPFSDLSLDVKEPQQRHLGGYDREGKPIIIETPTIQTGRTRKPRQPNIHSA